MSDNIRLEKSRNIYELWRTGDGDMGELAIGLYDLTAHYEALLDDYEKLEAKLSKMEEALDLIAEDALWHDGHDNPEALEDIRKTVKSLGYTKEALAGKEK